MNPDNARIPRITAAAGTELADAYSTGTLVAPRMALIAPRQKQFIARRAVRLHAAWLDQDLSHCPIFLTAASRRSLGRVSVPVWGASLSGPLGIIAMVGRYPAIKLMPRGPIPPRIAPLTVFQDLSPGTGHVAHALRTLPPVAATKPSPVRRAAPRLACVRPAASVHPEPGSNSSSYDIYYINCHFALSDPGPASSR